MCVGGNFILRYVLCIFFYICLGCIVVCVLNFWLVDDN